MTDNPDLAIFQLDDDIENTEEEVRPSAFMVVLAKLLCQLGT